PVSFLSLACIAPPCLLGMVTTLWRISILRHRRFTPLCRWLLQFRKRPLLAGWVAFNLNYESSSFVFPRTLLILPCLALAACAEKTVPPVPHEVDFVSATLGQAAEQAHGELAMLARLRGQGLHPLLPPADPSLNLPVSLAWT